MKRILLVLAFLSFLILPTAVFAKENSTVVLGQNEVVNKDYFAASGTVEVSGTVNGDVYVFGGEVIVDGKVNGDLIAAGGKVTVSGFVSQDVRVAGGQITITGSVGRNISVAGGSIEVIGGTIGGSVVVAGGSINLESPIGGNVKAAGGRLLVTTTIAGDLESVAADNRLASKAKVGGNFVYYSNDEASLTPGSVVGKTEKHVAIVNYKQDSEKVLGFLTGLSIFIKIISTVSTLVLGLILLYFFPVFFDRTVSTLRNRPWPSLGIGLIALVTTPILAVVLLITLLGIPLALILLAIYAVALYLARVFVIYWLGAEALKLTSREMNRYGLFVVGLIIFLLVSLLPIIGEIFTLLATLFGLGAAILSSRNTSAVSSPARRKA